MTEEVIDGQIVAEAAQERPKIVLNDVHSIHATPDQGVLRIFCNVTHDAGQTETTYDAFHTYSESDPYSLLSPLLKEWIAAHPGFPVSPYVPPTEEEKRRSMQPLTARQFRLGLVTAGISPAQVTATIAAMPPGPDRDKAQIEWEYATTFNRMHPLIATVGAALGLNDAQIDAMWLAAVNL